MAASPLVPAAADRGTLNAAGLDTCGEFERSEAGFADCMECFEDDFEDCDECFEVCFEDSGAVFDDWEEEDFDDVCFDDLGAAF